MEKIKKYWQDVVKEREDFWGSFFKKYEGDSKDSDIDIQTYMDSSSSRINGLLKLAEVGENNCPENPDEEGKDCKDMSNEILSGISLPTSTRKADSEKVVKADSQDSFVKWTRIKPTFTKEITAEDDENEKARNSERKLKLFELNGVVKDSVLETSLENDNSQFPSESLLNLSESDTSLRTEADSSIRFACRRIKSKNKHTSAPKRFKLV